MNAKNTVKTLLTTTTTTQQHTIKKESPTLVTIWPIDAFNFT